jgi:hypothetical protein
MPRETPRLLLITASGPDIQKMRRARVLSFQQITMRYALTLRYRASLSSR